MIDCYALDIETESTDRSHPEYALQPWRSESRITDICLYAGDGSFLDYHDTNLAGRFVWVWNGVFDVAFLMNKGYRCEGVQWLDAMSAAKWVLRSQATDSPTGARSSWSLRNIAEEHLRGCWSKYTEFIAVKSEIVDTAEYWTLRCKLDTIATYLLGMRFFSMLSDKAKAGFLIEQSAISLAAGSWVDGARYDFAAAKRLHEAIKKERASIVNRLGGVTKKTLDSPKKLSELIFEDWGVPYDDTYRDRKAKTDRKSVSKGVLSLLVAKHATPSLRLISEYRDLKTKEDKFIKGPEKARAYLGSDVMHHCLRLNSTYTGRCTVSSKQQRKYPIGIPLHQWPKEGDYRRFLVAPPGYSMIAADVDSQETKLMACYSMDRELIKIHEQGLKPHAITAAAISKVSYDDVLDRKRKGDETLYKGGKVVNLGKNYRMGHKRYRGRHSALYLNAHTKWGLTPTDEEVAEWGSVWEATYSGVVAQWGKFIARAQHYGYAETLAGRRFKISEWDSYSWASEASAIMQPIQGSGADMKYLAMAVMAGRFSNLRFWGEVHDEIIYLVNTTDSSLLDAMCVKIRSTLNNLPFKRAWGWEPIVPFTWTVGYGTSWKDIKEVVN